MLRSGRDWYFYATIPVLGAAAAPQGMAAQAASPINTTPDGSANVQDFAESGDFAGVSFDLEKKSALFRVTNTPALQSDEIAAAALVETIGWNAKFELVERMWSQLQIVFDGIPASSTFSAVAQDVLSQRSIDPVSNTVQIGLDTPSALAEEVAQKLWGDAVSFVSVPRGAQVATRLSDSSPWYEGDRLTMANNNGCTGGFEISISSTHRMLTAGHCDTTGTVYNGSTVIGSVVGGEFTNNGWDTVIVSGSFTPKVFTGGISSTTTHAVTGSYLPAVGEGGMCADGSYTAENCNGVVIVNNRNICHTYTDGFTTCHLGEISTSSSGGSSPVQPGDSGGPIYRKNEKVAGDLLAVGIINGATSDGQYVWYTPIGDLLSYWGATIITG